MDIMLWCTLFWILLFFRYFRPAIYVNSSPQSWSKLISCKFTHFWLVHLCLLIFLWSCVLLVFFIIVYMVFYRPIFYSSHWGIRRSSVNVIVDRIFAPFLVCLCTIILCEELITVIFYNFGLRTSFAFIQLVLFQNRNFIRRFCHCILSSWIWV